MWRCLVLLAAACGTPSGEVVFQPIQLDVDVVVSPAQVQIYTNNTDGTSGPGSEHDIFPLAETCVSDGDTLDVSPSCLTDFAILDNGLQIAHGTTDRGNKALAVDVSSLDAPVLHLVGCGGDAMIPLDVPPLTTPTISVSEDDTARTITATWGNATAVMLGFGDGLVEHRCQTQADPFVLQIPTGVPVDSTLYVDAQGLEGPTIAGTEIGEVRVWSGGFTSIAP